MAQVMTEEQGETEGVYTKVVGYLESGRRKQSLILLSVTAASISSSARNCLYVPDIVFQIE